MSYIRRNIRSNPHSDGQINQLEMVQRPAARFMKHDYAEQAPSLTC